MESLAVVKLASRMWFAPISSLLPLTEDRNACLPALSRAAEPIRLSRSLKRSGHP